MSRDRPSSLLLSVGAGRGDLDLLVGDLAALHRAGSLEDLWRRTQEILQDRVFCGQVSMLRKPPGAPPEPLGPVDLRLRDALENQLAPGGAVARALESLEPSFAPAAESDWLADPRDTVPPAGPPIGYPEAVYPLLGQARLVGALVIWSLRPPALLDREAALLRASLVAEHLGAALGALELRAAQDQELCALGDMAEAVVAAPGLSEGARLVLERLREMVPADLYAFVPEPGVESAKPVLLGAPAGEQERLVSALEPLARRALAAGGKAVLDLSRGKALPGGGGTEAGLKSALGVALRHGALLLGSLVAARRGADDTFGQGDRSRIERAAAVASVALGRLYDLDLLEEQRAALAEAKAAAEAASEAKSSFLASMSHEIRTPLNAVLGFAELLASEETDPEKLDRIRVILSAGEHLLATINDILDFSKIEAGKLDIDPRPFAPRQVAEDVQRLFEAQTRDKGIGFEAQVGSGVPDWVRGDDHRIRQILINLVGNAVKFTDAGRVGVRWSVDAEGRSVLEVADTGVGMTEEQQARVFEAFEQAERSTSRHRGGTGLGLAICRRLAELMDGEISVQSVPGRGSTFRVVLPLPEVEAPAAAGTDATAAAGPRLEPLRVLVVDDVPVNRVLLAALLGRADHTVLQAEHGAAALALLAESPVDVVLSDIEMPELDGWGLVRAIRADPHLNDLPVVAQTAHALPEFVAELEAAGFDGVVTKPVRPDALHRALEDAVRARRAARQRAG